MRQSHCKSFKEYFSHFLLVTVFTIGIYGLLQNGDVNISNAYAQTGNTYYVSTTGLDSNPGTISKPFRTLRHAVEDVARAGDTVIMRGGTYTIKGRVKPKTKMRIKFTANTQVRA